MIKRDSAIDGAPDEVRVEYFEHRFGRRPSDQFKSLYLWFGQIASHFLYRDCVKAFISFDYMRAMGFLKMNPGKIDLVVEREAIRKIILYYLAMDSKSAKGFDAAFGKTTTEQAVNIYQMYDRLLSQLSETGFFRNQFEPKKILKLKGKKEFNLSMEDRAIKKLRKQAGCEGIDSKTAKKYFDLNYGIDIYDVISSYREEFDGKLPSEVLADPGSPNGFINTAYIHTSILAEKLSSARTRFGFSGCKKEHLYRLPKIKKIQFIKD